LNLLGFLLLPDEEVRGYELVEQETARVEGAAQQEQEEGGPPLQEEAASCSFNALVAATKTQFTSFKTL